MTTKKDQQGFSVVEIAMAVVIVGLIGVVGWMFWTNTNNHDNTKASTAAVKSSPSPESVTTKTYESPTLNVAFDYPSNWSVTENQDNNRFFKERESSDRQLVKSPDGFTLLFVTLPYGGLGGTGPCDRKITEFKLEGHPQIKPEAGIVSYFVNSDFVLNISNPTLEGAQTDCLQYQEIIHVRDATMTADGSEFDSKPVSVLFGTNILGETQISKTKPSDKDLSDAIAILKSLRKT